MNILSYKIETGPILIFILFLSFVLLPIKTVSAEEDVSISADHMEFISSTDEYIAEGSVVITLDDATLKGDAIHYDGNTNIAMASGNVIFEDNDTVITADKISLNLKSKKGSMHNGYIFYKEQNIHIRGNTIEKISDKTFRIDKVSLTSCDADKPAWQIFAKDITIDQNERIKGWGGTLRANDKPVLYTPYFWAPLNRERHSGLLFPEFGYSNKRGSYYKQGIFWSIEDNQDATLYLDYYGRKGLAQGIDYRYMLSPETHGEFWLYHVKDKNPDRNLSEFKTYHNHQFSHDIAGYLKVHVVSHSDYYETMDSTSSKRFGLESWTSDPFGFSSEERLQKYLESNLHVSKSFYGGRAYFLGQGRQSLENSSKEIPQSVPELAFIINTQSKNNFSYNLAVKGTNFIRDKGQEGFRFDFNPNFYYSYGRLFNITQRIGLRETSYFLTNPSKNEARVLFDSSTKLTTKLLKKYDNFIHLIEPSIEYEHIPSVNHDDIPFFDSIDSINQASNINYALTNRLSGFNKYNLETRFRLSQSYSLLNIEKNFSPLLAEAIFSSDKFDISMNASYDVHDGKMSETIASIKFKKNKYYIGIGKNYRRSTDLDQYTFEAGITSPVRILNMSLPVDLHALLWYDVNGHGVQELKIESTYQHQCWAFSLNFNKKPDEYQIMLAIELKGIGNFSLGSI